MTKNTTLHKLFDVPDNTILNPEDISKLLNMHVESVRRWCRQGSLMEVTRKRKLRPKSISHHMDYVIQ